MFALGCVFCLFVISFFLPPYVSINAFCLFCLFVVDRYILEGTNIKHVLLSQSDKWSMDLGEAAIHHYCYTLDGSNPQCSVSQGLFATQFLSLLVEIRGREWVSTQWRNQSINDWAMFVFASSLFMLRWLVAYGCGNSTAFLVKPNAICGENNRLGAQQQTQIQPASSNEKVKSEAKLPTATETTTEPAKLNAESNLGTWFMRDFVLFFGCGLFWLTLCFLSRFFQKLFVCSVLMMCHLIQCLALFVVHRCFCIAMSHRI